LTRQVVRNNSKRRADEPASYCRRYPPNAKHPAEGAMKPLFRLTSLFDPYVLTREDAEVKGVSVELFFII
jgi:hypothetical protein